MSDSDYSDSDYSDSDYSDKVRDELKKAGISDDQFGDLMQASHQFDTPNTGAPVDPGGDTVDDGEMTVGPLTVSHPAGVNPLPVPAPQQDVTPLPAPQPKRLLSGSHLVDLGQGRTGILDDDGQVSYIHGQDVPSPNPMATTVSEDTYGDRLANALRSRMVAASNRPDAALRAATPHSHYDAAGNPWPTNKAHVMFNAAVGDIDPDPDADLRQKDQVGQKQDTAQTTTSQDQADSLAAELAKKAAHQAENDRRVKAGLPTLEETNALVERENAKRMQAGKPLLWAEAWKRAKAANGGKSPDPDSPEYAKFKQQVADEWVKKNFKPPSATAAPPPGRALVNFAIPAEQADAAPGDTQGAPQQSYADRVRAALQANSGETQPNPDKYGPGEEMAANEALGSGPSRVVSVAPIGSTTQNEALGSGPSSATTVSNDSSSGFGDPNRSWKDSLEYGVRAPLMLNPVTAVPTLIGDASGKAIADKLVEKGVLPEKPADTADTAHYDTPTGESPEAWQARLNKLRAQHADEEQVSHVGPAPGQQESDIPKPHMVPATEVPLTNPERQQGYALSGYREANATREVGQALGDQAKAKADALRNYAMKAEAMSKDEDQKEQGRLKILNDFTNKLEKQANDIKTAKVDPNRFWQNKSAGQKIALILSMAMGGFVAGLHGGPNYAMQSVEKEVDNDIAAQKEDILNQKTGLESAHNQLAAYRAMFGDMRAAEAASRADKYNALNAQVQAAQEQEEDPVKRAQYAALGANIQGKMQIELMKLNKWIPAHMEGGSPLATVDNEKYIPRAHGVYLGPKERLAAISNSADGMAKARRIIQEIVALRAGGAETDPTGGGRARLESLAAQLPPAFQESNNITRMSDPDIKLDEKMVGDPTQWLFKENADARLSQILSDINANEAALYHNNGIIPAKRLYDPKTGEPKTVLTGHGMIPDVDTSDRKPPKGTSFTPAGQ